MVSLARRSKTTTDGLINTIPLEMAFRRHRFLCQLLIAVIMMGSYYFAIFEYLPTSIIAHHPFGSSADASSPSQQQHQESTTSTTTSRTIAYAISVTDCQPGDGRLDQAAVVLYSIHLNSIRTSSSKSKYDYETYAFVHPDAKNCSEGLTNIGYDHVWMKESPVLKTEIQGTLQDFVHEASCCAEKEFLKLYSYTLINHTVAVHLDVDYLILQPLDNLFDAMMTTSDGVRNRVALQWPNERDRFTKNHPVEAYFTRDYNLVNPGVRQPHQIGIQGGFMILKTSMERFEEYKSIIIDGNYTRDIGWGGPRLRYGGYYGAAQIQGLMSYYFGAVRPHRAYELDRCTVNWMGDNPRDVERGNQCRTLQKECRDCRNMTFDDIQTVHYTICTKPWWCMANSQNPDMMKFVPLGICQKAIRQWFTTRKLLEEEWSRENVEYKMELKSYLAAVSARTLQKDAFRQDVNTLSYCAGGFQYVPMWLPRKNIPLSDKRISSSTS